MFVDQQRQPGQHCAFTVLGETPGLKGCRRFVVKLSLEQPDESVLASYYVFGGSPVWVYRAEDFDMILHMDKSMMPDPRPAEDHPGSETNSSRGTRSDSSWSEERQVWPGSKFERFAVGQDYRRWICRTGYSLPHESDERTRSTSAIKSTTSSRVRQARRRSRKRASWK